MGNMVLRSSLILLIALAGVFFKTSIPTKEDNIKKEFFTLQAVVKFLDRVHFAPRQMDDELSAHVYDRFIKYLDPAKRFLTQQDIDQLSTYRLQLDDAIEDGSFEFLDLAVTLISSGISKSQQFYEERITQPFDLHETGDIVLNASKRDWSADDESLKSFWNDLIQYEVMSKVYGMKEAQAEEEEKSEVEILEESIESVKTNFDEWFTRLNSLRRSDRFEDFLNAVTGTFDPHSNYFSPKEKEDFDINMSGSYEGIGARLTPEGELTKVSQIIPGGPAWKQKDLEENDLIIEVAQAGEDSKDVRGWRIDDVISLIRGKKGTEVILTVKKTDGQVQKISIVRDQVVIEEGKAKSLILSLEGEESKVGYIKLPKFYFEADGQPGCAEDVKTEVEKLSVAGVQGIILDLRNNGGGSLSEVVDMSGLFIEEGPIVQVKSRERKPYVLEDEDDRVHYKGPLVIMVNHFSASASEIIAAAMQDYNRAIIVGSSSTFGKGTVQRFHQLDRFVVGNNDLKPLGEVKITTQKFYRVNGGSTQLRGVVPDIVLPSLYNYIKIGEKEYETPLEWSQIEPVDYQQQVSFLPDRESLSVASAERIANHPTFQLVEERAKLLKAQEEEALAYPLDIDNYQAMLEERERTNSRFKDMYQPIDRMIIENLEQDIPHINSDEARKANNEDHIKSVKKDIYLEEVIQIIGDMLSNQ